MLQSTKKILEELYEISPSLKGDEEKLKSLVVFLEQYQPPIKPKKEFRQVLARKLRTIGEFKQIQTKPKFNLMSFIRPVFLMIFGLFALSQFHNFLSLDQVDVTKLPSPDTQEFMIEPSSQTEETLISEGVDPLDDARVTGEKASEKNTTGDSSESARNLQESVEESETQSIPTNISQTQQETSNINSQQIKSEAFRDKDTAVSKNEAFIETSEETQKTPEGEGESPVSSEVPPLSEGESQGVQTSGNALYSLDEAPSKETSQDETNTSVDSYKYDNASIETLDSQKDEPIIEEQPMGIHSVSDDESSSGEYYTCRDGELEVEDSRSQRNIIKAYCEEKGGELLTDPNIKYYLCRLDRKKEVGIDYISRDLCE